MSTDISKSPNRFSFQKEGYLKRQAEKGLTPENDAQTRDMAAYYDSWKKTAEENESNPHWQKDNMEFDLRTSEQMLTKVRENDAYAQNLYAAICNNDFIKLEIIPILKEQTWSASWRYAGGIIADMRREGDYIDWYCSGIRQVDYDEEVNKEWDGLKYVSEGKITDEVRKDLQQLGWVPAPGGDWENFE